MLELRYNAERSLLALAVLLFSTALACDRSVAGEAQELGAQSSESSPQLESPPAVIDAEWVASKFQAPPAPKPKDWLREIEKDPIAALKEMDPAALQPSRNSGPGTPESHTKTTEIRPKEPATYEPQKPLKGWPPVVGQFYPNLVLRDQAGQVVSISDFQGKVILLEVVGLTCKACHAFAGGNEPGKPRFRGIEPQRGLDSIERYANGYAKLSLDHPDVVFVQLVLFGMDGRGPPEEEDVRAWAEHFQMDRRRNEVVLVGDQRFISPATRKLIPGFHLIDQNGILRAMSSNDPNHDRLHSSLLPKLANLVNRE